MTPLHPCRKALGRLGLLTLLVSAVVNFAMIPAALNLAAPATELWYVVGWTVAPLLAGFAAFRTAARCDGSVRQAWRSFGLGCSMWMAGTLVWAGYGWVGAVLPFPSLADALYISTGAMFMIGMFHYSLPGSSGSRIQVTNFAVAISAVVAIGFILYYPVLANSSIGWFGAVIAFTYPALWLGTFAFGLICYALYVPHRRRFPFLLILGTVGASSIANYFYGFDILNETYSVGRFYDTYWILGFALLGWAALEHDPAKGVPLRAAGQAQSALRPGEALIPALSVAAILVAGVAARWPHLRPEAMFVVPAIVVFTALLAIREHALFTTERKLRAQAEVSARQLAESEKQLSGVLENTTDGVMVLDTAWRVTFANKNAIDMLFSDRPFLGIPIWEVLSPVHDNEFYRNYCIAMEQQRPVEFEAYFAPLDMWFEVHAFPTPDNLTIFFRDMTERRRLREELVRLSRHDPLTGLANRILFIERLALGLQGDRRHSDLNLLLIDLDGFKAVNDSMGHMAGDCLLQQFAKRLIGLVRQGDTVARFGGDEFAIIQPWPIAQEGGAEVARRILEALHTPFEIQGTEVTLGASIGIAMAPAHGTQPDELIHNADLALYRAKANKGSDLDYCVFEPGVTDCVLSRQSPPRLNLQRA
jgi:diguanylate cyclase (GGDEF)-like protein/PAS domain S-box-containing protein